MSSHPFWSVQERVGIEDKIADEEPATISPTLYQLILRKRLAEEIDYLRENLTWRVDPGREGERNHWVRDYICSGDGVEP
jgi:hypothetical protein